MIVLGLDVALRHGGAALVDFGKIARVRHSESFRADRSADQLACLDLCVTWLERLHRCSIAATAFPKVIAIEDVYGGPNAKTNAALAKAQGCVLGYYLANKVDSTILVVSTSDVRRCFGLPTNASKGDVQKRILALADTESQNEDEIDAVGIAFAAHGMMLAAQLKEKA